MNKKSKLTMNVVLSTALMMPSLALLAEEQKELNHVEACRYFLKEAKAGDLLKTQFLEVDCKNKANEVVNKFCSDLTLVNSDVINEIYLPYYVKRVSRAHCIEAGDYFASSKGRKVTEFALDYTANPETAFASDDVF